MAGSALDCRGCTFGPFRLGGLPTVAIGPDLTSGLSLMGVVRPRVRRYSPRGSLVTRARDRLSSVLILSRRPGNGTTVLAYTSESCRRKPSSISWGQPSTKNNTLMARCRFGIGRHHRLRRSGDASENFLGWRRASPPGEKELDRFTTGIV
jgi:hypothetical protein